MEQGAFLNRPDLMNYIPRETLSWAESRLGHPEMGVVGRCLALIADAKTDVRFKGLSRDWVTNTRQPLMQNLERNGFTFLGDVAIPGFEVTQQGFTFRPRSMSLSGYVGIFQLPEGKSAPIGALKGDVISGTETGYLQVCIGQEFFNGRHKLLENLAGWSSKAVEQLGAKRIDLKPIDSWVRNAASKNILLVASRG